MTAGQSLNERMQGKGEFFHLEDRASDHLLIEKVWRCYTDRGDTFLSVAANFVQLLLVHRQPQEQVQHVRAVLGILVLIDRERAPRMRAASDEAEVELRDQLG